MKDVAIQGLPLPTEKPRVAAKRVNFPILKTSKRKDVVALEQFQRAEAAMYEARSRDL